MVQWAPTHPPVKAEKIFALSAYRDYRERYVPYVLHVPYFFPKIRDFVELFACSFYFCILPVDTKLSPKCDVAHFYFFIFGGDLFLFCLFVLYSALLHLPPLKFNCADGCWDRTTGLVYWQSDALTTRLDLIRLG